MFELLFSSVFLVVVTGKPGTANFRTLMFVVSFHTLMRNLGPMKKASMEGVFQKMMSPAD
jgi:hypothetical protein